MQFPDGNAGFVLGGVVRFGMAVVFVQSAVSALRDWSRHVGAVEGYRLVPVWSVGCVSALLTAANIVAALLLVAPVTARWGAYAGCVLLIVYAAAMKINLWRGRTNIACGCGGARGQTISGLLVGRNMVLAGLLARASLCSMHGSGDAMTLVALFGGAASFAALHFAASQLLANKAAMA